MLDEVDDHDEQGLEYEIEGQEVADEVMRPLVRRL